MGKASANKTKSLGLELKRQSNHRQAYVIRNPPSTWQNLGSQRLLHRLRQFGSTPINRTNHHSSPNMIGRSALTRGAQLALRRQNGAKLAQRRAYAATAGASTETASFESTEINGIKVASRDPRSPTTRLTVVAKAGTRYQPMPGLSVGLEEFAFKASRPVITASGACTAGSGRKGR